MTKTSSKHQSERTTKPTRALTRRSLLSRAGVVAALSLAFSGIWFGLRRGAPSLAGRSKARVHRREPVAPPGPPRLAVARGEDPAALVRAALKAHGGLPAIVSRGDAVLVKPNVGWDRRAHLAANTNPAVVRETVRLCLDAGAGRVVVTDNSCNNPERCFDRSGIRDALSDLPADLLIPGERDFVEVETGGPVVGRWPVLRVFLECDRVVNLPVAKHHSSAGLTMGMKNWYGILGGGRQRGRLHQKMAEGIVELAGFARPDLTILDAYRIIFRNGPQGGSLNDTRDLKTVAVTTDPVAADAFGASLFGLEPHQVPYIPLGEAAGLGRMDDPSLERIEVEA